MLQRRAFGHFDSMSTRECVSPRVNDGIRQIRACCGALVFIRYRHAINVAVTLLQKRKVAAVCDTPFSDGWPQGFISFEKPSSMVMSQHFHGWSCASTDPTSHWGAA